MNTFLRLLKPSFGLATALLLLSLPLQAQTVSPSTLNIGTDVGVCTGGSADYPVSITLPAGATSDKVDVFLLMDDTGSFAGLVSGVSSLFNTLITQLEASLPGVEFGFGVGRFEDYGGPGTGFSGENSEGRPFILNQPIVTSATAGGTAARNTLISQAFSRSGAGFGGDLPETAIEALYQVATGAGFDGNGDGSTLGSGPAGQNSTQTSPGTSGDVPAFASNVAPASGTLGGVGWRADAQKLVIVATDICTVSPFVTGEPIPATITGIGGTEPVSAFACSSTSPGADRFGFVSNAVSTAGNTVSGAIAPTGSATVQATVDALNALGIQVLGLATGGGATSATGASFGPNVFLSALARLTGALNDEGNPLVFQIGTSAAAIAAAIEEAVETAVTASVDIELVASGLPAGLSLSADPSVVAGVAPGGTANFSATLSGDGSDVSGTFNLQFRNATSGGLLASIPVTVDCDGGLVCLPSEFEQRVDRENRRILLTITDPEGIARVDFTDPEGTPVLENLMASSPHMVSTDGIHFLPDNGPPMRADFTLQATSDRVRYFARIQNDCGAETVIDPPHDFATSTEGVTPTAFAVDQNYPNPFHAQTAIAIQTAEPGTIRVTVYDFLGREVAVLHDAHLPAGSHTVVWDGSDHTGQAVSNGTYLYRVQAGSSVATLRMTLIRP